MQYSLHKVVFPNVFGNNNWVHESVLEEIKHLLQRSSPMAFYTEDFITTYGFFFVHLQL